MNCKAVQSRLSAYLDRELTGAELFELRAHLSQCDDCSAEETALRQLKQMLGGMSTPEPSIDFADRLCANVLKNRVEQPRTTLRATVFSFASVAACSALATFVFSTLRSEVPTVLPTQAESHDVAFDIQREQAYSMGLDATNGANVMSVANYAGR